MNLPISTVWVLCYLTVAIIIIATLFKIYLYWKKYQIFAEQAEKNLEELDKKIEQAIFKEQQLDPSFKQLKRKYKEYLESKEQDDH